VLIDFQVGWVATHGANIDDGKHHDIAVTFDAAIGPKVYIDGIESATYAGPNGCALGAVHTTGDYISMGLARESNYFNGQIQEIGIYNKELSPDQIQSFMQTSSLSTDGLVAAIAQNNVFVANTASGNQAINGTSDFSLNGLVNIKEDKAVFDSFISAAEFTTSSDNAHVNVILNVDASSLKSLHEIEVVQFKDATVRIVGAEGYASFAEAMNQSNNSHALNGEYIYGSSSHGFTPTASDLTHLTAVADHSDFYTYHG
jgi:hypothetical protein